MDKYFSRKYQTKLIMVCNLLNIKDQIKFEHVKRTVIIILMLLTVLGANAARNDSIPKVDSLLNNEVIDAWMIDIENLGKVKIPIDTIIDQFHIINPLLKNDISYSFLGKIGTAAISNHYFSRTKDHNFIFLEPYKQYIHFPFECNYYNTKKPFTNISFTTAGNKKKREESFRVIHTQNITPAFNYGIDFEHILSKGQYQKQRAKIYEFTMFVNYQKKKYSLHANMNINSIEVQENGGIENDSLIEDSETKTEDITVNLIEAKSRLRSNSFFILQQYKIGSRIEIVEQDSAKTDTASNALTYIFKPKLQVSHLFNMESSKRGFTDNAMDIEFYPAVYSDSTSTFDTLYNRTITNSLQIEILEGLNSKLKVGGKVLISNETDNYGYNTPGVFSVATTPQDTSTYTNGTFIFYQNDTTYYYPGESYLSNNNWNKSYFSNNLVSVSLFNRHGLKGNWNFTGKYYITGYKKEDYEIRGRFNHNFQLGKKLTKNEKDSIVFNVSFLNRKKSPNFFFTQYFSNHYKWFNKLDDENESVLKATISKPSNGFEMGLNYSLIQNYLYLDSLALPKQEESVFYIWSAYLNKKFTLGKFYFDNKAVYQQTGNEEILRLPEVLLYNSSYFQHLIRFKSTGGSMKMKLGFDFYYHSKYYADVYSPALGLFYQQNLLIENAKKIGDCPYFDLFLTLKIKKLRILLKYDHIIKGINTERYFTSPHYPMNRKVFKLGLSWSFYD